VFIGSLAHQTVPMPWESEKTPQITQFYAMINQTNCVDSMVLMTVEQQCLP
jgi:hypothetical protein